MLKKNNICLPSCRTTTIHLVYYLGTAKAGGDFADIISARFNTLPWLSDCYDQCNSKQTTRARYKTFPCAKAARPSREPDLKHIITAEYLADSCYLETPVLPGCSRKAAFVPSPSARKRNSNPFSGTKVLPRSLARRRRAERVAKQRQPARGSRLTRDAPASANNSCHVDKTVQGNGKLLRAFS